MASMSLNVCSSRPLFAGLLYGLPIFKDAYAFYTNRKGKNEVSREGAVLLIEQHKLACKWFFGGGTDITQIQVIQSCMWFFFVSLLFLLVCFS